MVAPCDLSGSEDPELSVSAEIIYRACHDRTCRSGLKPGSWNEHPHRQRHRKHRGRGEQAMRSAMGECRAMVSQPASADDRSESGHWEGDLTIGRANQTAGLHGGYDPPPPLSGGPSNHPGLSFDVKIP